MSKKIQFDKHEKLFLQQQFDSKRANVREPGILSMVCSVSLKKLRKLDKWRTKEEATGLKNCCKTPKQRENK